MKSHGAISRETDVDQPVKKTLFPIILFFDGIL